MKQNKLAYILLMLFMFTCTFAASEDLYPFKKVEDEKRFQSILGELRCLVCQNQTLMDSDAPLAVDLRKDVYRLMQEGKSNDEIIAFLTSRYGDFVLYNPPLKPTTYFLWFAPVILLFLGGLFLIKNRKK